MLRRDLGPGWTGGYRPVSARGEFSHLTGRRSSPFPANFSVSGGLGEDQAGAAVDAGVGDQLVDVSLRDPVGETLPVGVDHTRDSAVAAYEDVGAGRVTVPAVAVPRAQRLLAPALRDDLEPASGRGFPVCSEVLVPEEKSHSDSNQL